jgi:neutral ceramidase
VCSSGNNDLSADYPGELVAALRKRTGCPHVLFAAGAVGEASPARFPAANEHEATRVMGHALADDLAKVLGDVRFERQVPLAALRVPIVLPEFRVPVSARWRISPVSSSWISDSHTHLHGLRIGPAVLVGFPGDYSGRLAKGLAEWGAARGLTLVPTSFNGDYKGYFVSEQSYMNLRSYETRDMNFFGPWAGEYLADLSKRMVERLAP